MVNTINKIYYDYLLAFTNHKYYIENLHVVICMCYIVQLEIGITTYLQFINITETMYIHMSIDYTINIRGKKEQIILNNQQSLCQLWRIWDKGNVLQYLGAINSTVDNFGNTTDEIQSSIISELQTICKWLDLNKLCLNVNKSKFMLFHMPQRVTPLLHFELNGSPIEYIQEFNFLGLTLDSSLSFKFHLTKIRNKISRVIGLLHKLKHIFPSYILRMIYNSLILPHMNYSLLAWGANCHSIELLQKKAVRVINFKSPLAHTEPILKGMDQLKLPDMYTCHLIKLYYKL